MDEEKKRKYRICPYLGQKSDADTALSYPHELNRCYHAKPVAAIDLGHQEEFCLTTGYPNCKEYAKDPDAAFPTLVHKSAGRRLQKRRGNKMWVWGIVLVVLGIIVAGLLFMRGRGFGLFSAAPIGITESTETSTEISSIVPSPTIPITPTPTLAGTATTRPLLGLETPLGIDHKFLIHQIQEGDSLDRIAGQHGTTVAVLMAINYRLPSPIVPGWAIVVPINMSDTQGFPAFEVFGVTEEISLADLAIQLSADLNQLEHFNALDDNLILKAGDYLLVPRIGLPTSTP